MPEVFNIARSCIYIYICISQQLTRRWRGFLNYKNVAEYIETFINEVSLSFLCNDPVPSRALSSSSSTFYFLLFLITFNKPRLFLGILLFLEKLIPSFIQHLEQVAQSPRRELFDSYLFQIYL